jgi:hypothetical protein
MNAVNYSRLESQLQNRRSNIEFSTFSNSTAGDLIYIRSSTIDIENRNIISNFPNSSYPNLFIFASSGPTFSNVLVAKNNHPIIGPNVPASGGLYCQNGFSTENENYDYE